MNLGAETEVRRLFRIQVPNVRPEDQSHQHHLGTQHIQAYYTRNSAMGPSNLCFNKSSIKACNH